MKIDNFFAELKRRNVYKVAVAYAIVGWLLIQIATQVFPFFEIPNWAVRLIVLAIVIGFPIALIIAWAFELTPEGLKRTEDVGHAAEKRGKSHAWIYVVAVGAVLSIGLFFLGRYSTGNNIASEATGSSSIPQKSIAVLPFENLSSDKENAYFAEGIQDEILTRLSKIAALKVISRTSTQKYKSAPDNLREIGQQLGVANLLEGTVQKAGNAVHINVQLIKAATDEHLWAESYDRKIDDIFGVEKEVAQNIAIALKAKLSGAEEHVLAQKPTDNPAAYEAYLRGKALLWGGDEGALRGAIQSFEEAVRLDPQFALAWANLSSARSIGFYYMDSTPAARAAAEQSLAKAEALQPELPEIQLARANFGYFVLGDNKNVRDVLQQLHLIWPNNAEVIQTLAFTYQRLGEWQKASDAFDQVIVLNPRYLQVQRFAAYTRCDMRDWAGAQRIVDEALRIWPADLNFLAIKAQIFQANGQFDEAQLIVDKLKPDRLDYDAVGAVWYQAKLQRKPATALKVLEPLASRTDSLKEWVRDAQVLGDLQQLSGDTVAARATFSTVRDAAEAGLREQPDNVRFLGLLSLALAGLGERDKALQAIDKKIFYKKGAPPPPPPTKKSRAYIPAPPPKEGRLLSFPAPSGKSSTRGVCSAHRSLPLCSDSIRIGTISVAIRAFRNFAKRPMK